MRITILFLAYFLLLSNAWGQEDFLAKQYFDDGDFDKAVVFYEKLTEKNPNRTDYIKGLVSCYQQLKRYEDADTFLKQKLSGRNRNPTLLIELGYNYTLQEATEEANTYFDEAIRVIDKNPNYGYALGYQFQKYNLLDRAVAAYQKAMDVNPKLDYNFQLARIYGEQGNVDKMYRAYLDMIARGKTSKSNILRSINDFVTSDPEHQNNITLKTLLLERVQKTPDITWNELLSWLFVQQRQYGSAFRQEKAIYKRIGDEDTSRLESLGNLALEEKDTEVAKEVFEYISKESTDVIAALEAELYLIDIALSTTKTPDLEAIEKTYESLLDTHGYKTQTLQLQVAYANFLTFKKDDPEPAIVLLKKALELPINERGTAFIKLALGDILVYHTKFNEALIYFSQIQQKLKNDILGQNARYKVAETSFYKSDFDWALTQLKVLRSSTSQLIANDAMQLSLLISDNSLEDSTQTALKKYARADFLAYQNKTTEAIASLEEIVQQHKGEKIEDEALLKQAELLVSIEKYDAAELNYLKIIEFYNTGILADDAYFALGELYQNILNEPEKAKAQFEKIIYNYQDSYYFPQARKNFRLLRGDAVN